MSSFELVNHQVFTSPYEAEAYVWRDWGIKKLLALVSGNLPEEGGKINVKGSSESLKNIPIPTDHKDLLSRTPLKLFILGAIE